MELTEFFPERPTFELKSKGKNYTLRIPNLEDRARFREWLGDEKNAQAVFNDLRWEIIAKLVYRLLIEKEDFQAFTENGFDDDGVKITKLITGPAVLMRSVTSLEESMVMLGALISAMRAGDPLIDKAVSQAFSEEKKSTLSQTGSPSLTQSHQSTDIPQSSLEG